MPLVLVEESAVVSGLEFTLVDRVFAVDGASVTRARRAVGLTMQETAKRCGWSFSWQRVVEAGRPATLRESSARVLARVLGLAWDET